MSSANEIKHLVVYQAGYKSGNKNAACPAKCPNDFCHLWQFAMAEVSILGAWRATGMSVWKECLLTYTNVGLSSFVFFSLKKKSAYGLKVMTLAVFTYV